MNRHRDKTLTVLFEEQAARTPDRIALIGCSTGHGSYKTYMTYDQLNRKAGQLARLLLDKGVMPGAIIAVKIEKSIEMIAAALGILKAGAAYLPIDPDYPEDRIDYMLADSATELLLTVRDGALILTPTPRRGDPIVPTPNGAPLSRGDLKDWEHLGKSPLERGARRAGCVGSAPCPATRLCYIIYTSGSTGRPKGVMIEHRNVVAYVRTTMDLLNLTERDVRTQQSSFSFDQFVEEVYPILFSGGKLVILQKSEVQDIEVLRDILERYGVTVFSTTPAVLKELNRYGPGSGLRAVIVGGDVLKKEYITNFVPRLPVYNFYGPTETTVCATHYCCSGGEEGSIPVGKPKAGYQVYIPDGEAGEIYIGGAGVCRGYLNRPELTNQKVLQGPGAVFQKSPWPPEARFYRTGDLGRWLPDGNIEFLGRADRQVKIRGFRIEPGEIENKLTGHPRIGEAVVMPVGDGDSKNLCAWYVDSAGHIYQPLSVRELREYLSRDLPGYMVPSYFVPVDRIPVTANGKVDQKALPAPVITGGDGYTAPNGAVERKLVEIWAGVLDVPAAAIGTGDNFFELGGHSLKATAVKTAVKKTFNADISLADIFERPFIGDLARLIGLERLDRTALPQPLDTLDTPGPYDASYGQERVWILSQFEEASLSFNITAVYYLEEAVDRACMDRSFNALVRRHESLRTVFLSGAGEIKQQVMAPEAAAFNLEHIDLRKFQDRDAEVERLSEQEKNTLFDLARGPLLRAKLVQTDEERFILLFTMHHIVSDFLSCEVLIKDLDAFYRGYGAGKREPLKPLKIQYKDYAAWQRRQMEEGRFKVHRKYWLQRFTPAPPVLRLPLDGERPRVKSYGGETLYFSVGSALTEQLRSLAGRESVTLYIVFLTVVNVFLYRYTGQTDIVVGIPAAGRDLPGLEEQIGFFLNTLALRTKFGEGDTFKQVLKTVGTAAREAYGHQAYPFDRLVEQLGLARDISRHPLFDVMVDMVDLTGYAGSSRLDLLELKALEEDALVTRRGKSKFDLTVLIFERRESIDFGFEYDTGLFEQKTVRRMVKRFRKLLESAAANTGSPIRELETEAITTLPSLPGLSRRKNR